MKGIQVCSNEGPRPFPSGDIYKIAKIHWRNFKIFFWRITGPIFKLNWHIAPLDEVDSSLFTWRTRHFPRGDYEIAKIQWRNLKILSRTTGSISTKLATMHSWVIGIQVCSNDLPPPPLFPRGDIYKIAKIHLRN